MPTITAVYTALGVVGSLITACSCLPQIYRVIKRERAQDISYTYQAVFIAGIAMFLAYYGYYQLWAVFFPTILSLVFMLSLVGLKVRLEECPPPHAAAAATSAAGGKDQGGDSPEPPRRRARVTAAAGPADGSGKSEMQPLMSSW